MYIMLLYYIWYSIFDYCRFLFNIIKIIFWRYKPIILQKKKKNNNIDTAQGFLARDIKFYSFHIHSIINNIIVEL